MKKNIMKRSMALACAFVLSMGASGCNNPGNSSSGAESTGYEVWTTYNTTKVLRDVELSGDYVRMDKGTPRWACSGSTATPAP